VSGELPKSGRGLWRQKHEWVVFRIRFFVSDAVIFLITADPHCKLATQHAMRNVLYFVFDYPFTLMMIYVHFIKLYLMQPSSDINMSYKLTLCDR